MARFSQRLHILSALEGGQPIRTGTIQFRLSWRGRLVATALMLPGIASVLASLFLPNSDQGGVFSVAAVTFYIGGFAVLAGPASALIHAFWTPSLRKVPDLPEWSLVSSTGWVPTLTGWMLAGANVVAAVWFGLLSSHAWVEFVPSGLYAAAAAAHATVTITRRG